MNWQRVTVAIWDAASELSRSRYLGDGQLHLWRWRLDADDPGRDAGWLTADESARAARYRFDLPRRRFVAARAGLRRILGSYLGVNDPQAFPFCDGPYGKPGLVLPEQQWLRFNLAHTHELALCAVCRDREIGVDVERVAGGRASVPSMSYAVRHLYSPAEREFLDGDASKAGARFLTLWTCKEAIGKARGTGLRPPIPSVDPVLTPGLPALPDAWLQRDATRLWWVARLEPFPATVGALAVEIPSEHAAIETPLTWFDLG
jgi:4'-phosphopantetheinyl transferase